MNLFYAETLQNGICTLSPEESVHCCRVLRLKEGEKIQVTDGEGSLYLCSLLKSHEKQCLATVDEVLEQRNRSEITSYVHLALAPTKNMDRIEWFMEKACELGVQEISFILTEHSERKILKMERLEKILFAAMKQSRQLFLPKLNELETLDAFLTREEKRELLPHFQGRGKFIAYCGQEYEKKLYFHTLQPKSFVTTLIGPEGDFSPEEVKKCVEKGYVPVSLCETRLRTETAALYAVWASHFKNL